MSHSRDDALSVTLDTENSSLASPRRARRIRPAEQKTDARRRETSAAEPHGSTETRETPVIRQIDDYSMFSKSDGATWAVCGLKLSTDTLTFPSRAEAVARGTALARAARVSLWFEPTSHRRDAVLVTSFRDDPRP
jgi:hypothetical protein